MVILERQMTIFVALNNAVERRFSNGKSVTLARCPLELGRLGLVSASPEWNLRSSPRRVDK
jgi:hypothetical protein